MVSALAEKYQERDEVLAGFSQLGLGEKAQEAYQGAEIFGAQFKKCSVLKDVATVYTRSSAEKIK